MLSHKKKGNGWDELNLCKQLGVGDILPSPLRPDSTVADVLPFASCSVQQQIACWRLNNNK